MADYKTCHYSEVGGFREPEFFKTIFFFCLQKNAMNGVLDYYVWLKTNETRNVRLPY